MGEIFTTQNAIWSADHNTARHIELFPTSWFMRMQA
jgi:hypothetical protein